MVDEMYGAILREFFESRGHKVFVVGESLPRQSSDREVAAFATKVGGIIVTANEKDFDRIVGARAPKGTRQRPLRGAGCLYTPNENALRRLEKVMPTIEAVIACAETWTDKRVFIKVRKQFVSVRV